MSPDRRLVVSVMVSGGGKYVAGTTAGDIPAEDLDRITNPDVWDTPEPESEVEPEDEKPPARPRKTARKSARS